MALLMDFFSHYYTHCGDKQLALKAVTGFIPCFHVHQFWSNLASLQHQPVLQHIPHPVSSVLLGVFKHFSVCLQHFDFNKSLPPNNFAKLT